jgi:hypothetical protein
MAIGLNPIEICGLAFGLALAQDRYAESFFVNSADPRGVIEMPGDLDVNEAKAWVKSWLASKQGINQAHLPAVLTQGAKFNPISISPTDSQLLEALGFSEERISGRIYRVPPHLIGLTDKVSCLPADALVQTLAGPKPIVDVQVGEEVWSLGEDGPITETVTAQQLTGYKPLLSVEGESGRVVRATANHVFPIRRDSSPLWVRADEIEAGDCLLAPSNLYDGHAVDLTYDPVRSITYGQEAVPVYDLSVTGSHTFVGEGVWLHNSWGRLPRHRAAEPRLHRQYPRPVLHGGSGGDHGYLPSRPVRSLRPSRRVGGFDPGARPDWLARDARRVPSPG